MKRLKLLLMILLVVSTIFCLACGRKAPPVLSEYENYSFEVSFID